MAYEKFPNQTGQNFPVPTQYATHPSASVGFPVSPQYDTFPSGVSNPLSILGAAGMYGWWRSDTGVTEAGGAGTGVSAWAPMAGSGSTSFTQGTATNRPSYSSRTLNGMPVITGDGTDNFLDLATAIPAPGTTPFFVWLIVLQETWTASDRVFGSSAGVGVTMLQSATTPRLRTFSGVANSTENAAAALTTWVRGEALFTNSTSDYLKLAATSVTGVNTGNTGAAAFRLFSISGGANTGNISLAEIVLRTSEPTADQKAALSAYATAFWGGSVGV